MKRTLFIILVLVIMVLSFSDVFAESNYDDSDYYFDYYAYNLHQMDYNVSIYIDDVKFNSEPSAFKYYSTTFLPLRAVSENLGFDVEWNGEINEVKISNKEKEISLIVEQTYSSYDEFLRQEDFALQPTIIEGRTFVPLRSVLETLGFYVSWDNATQSVYIYEKTFSQKEDSRPQKEVVVSNMTELLNEIESDKHIKLNDGFYNVSEVEKDFINKKNVSFYQITDNGGDWDFTTEDRQLEIKNVTNLTIEGINDKKAVIVSESIYQIVLLFTNSSDITLKNIRAEHQVEEKKHFGEVLRFKTGKNIEVDNCLFNEGGVGVYLSDIDGFNMRNSIIENCNWWSVVAFYNSKNCFLNNVTMRNNNGVRKVFDIYECENIIFDNCDVSDNCLDYSISLRDNSLYYHGDFFQIRGSTEIKYINCNFKNNLGQQDGRIVYPVDFISTTFENNEFDDVMTSPKYTNIPLSLSDVTIKGVTFYMTIEEVVKILSEPEEIKNGVHENNKYINDPTYKHMIYDDITVGFTFRDYVSSIYVTDANFQTERGIKLGSTKTDVLEAYGYPDSTNRNEMSYSSEDDNWVDNASHGLTFEITDDVVTAIYICMYYY